MYVCMYVCMHVCMYECNCLPPEKLAISSDVDQQHLQELSTASKDVGVVGVVRVVGVGVAVVVWYTGLVNSWKDQRL